MKKLVALMLILALCVACFAGCGGKNETATTGGSESKGEISGTDGAINPTENDETLSAEDLETLPEAGDDNGVTPEIDIDVDVDVDPTEGTTDPDDGNTDETTEPETTESTTADPTQSTQDDNTEETTEPTQSDAKPPKDYTGDDEDDFVIDFGDLIGKG